MHVGNWSRQETLRDIPELLQRSHDVLIHDITPEVMPVFQPRPFIIPINTSDTNEDGVQGPAANTLTFGYVPTAVTADGVQEYGLSCDLGAFLPVPTTKRVLELSELQGQSFDTLGEGPELPHYKSNEYRVDGLIFTDDPFVFRLLANTYKNIPIVHAHRGRFVMTREALKIIRESSFTPSKGRFRIYPHTEYDYPRQTERCVLQGEEVILRTSSLLPAGLFLLDEVICDGGYNLPTGFSDTQINLQSRLVLCGEMFSPLSTADATDHVEDHYPLQVGDVHFNGTIYISNYSTCQLHARPCFTNNGVNLSQLHQMIGRPLYLITSTCPEGMQYINRLGARPESDFLRLYSYIEIYIFLEQNLNLPYGECARVVSLCTLEVQKVFQTGSFAYAHYIVPRIQQNVYSIRPYILTPKTLALMLLKYAIERTACTRVV